MPVPEALEAVRCLLPPGERGGGMKNREELLAQLAATRESDQAARFAQALRRSSSW